MKKIIYIRIILIILLILWMMLVFGFSNQNAEESSSVSFKISKILTRGDEELAHKIEPYVRKLAHYSEYTVGGILIFLLFLTFEKPTEKLKILFSLIIGIIYAISDEIHQLFIRGRACQITDVLIDTLGVITGILIILIIKNIIKYKSIGADGSVRPI